MIPLTKENTYEGKIKNNCIIHFHNSYNNGDNHLQTANRL
jgi:hypothetical protein